MSNEEGAAAPSLLAQREYREENKAFRADSTGVLRPGNLAEAMRLADIFSKSEFVPKRYQGKPGDILAAIMMGQEVGIAPIQALIGIAVINGTPSMYGDLLLAVCRVHPEWGGISETGDATQAKCVVVRFERGIDGKHVAKMYTGTFTIEEAKVAKLLDKEGPWKTYPKRMLQMRARAFALRDGYADALKGLASSEEMLDVVAIDTEGQEMPPTPVQVEVTSAPVPPKKGAEGLRDKLQTKAPTPAHTAPEQAAPAALPSAATTFLAELAVASTKEKLDDIRTRMEAHWGTWSTDDKAAVGKAGVDAWKRLSEAANSEKGA